MAWFNDPVTQGYGQNGETGVDIGTPFHTPITLPYGGTVVGTTYADYGGLVQIASNIPGLGNVVQSFVHLDLINVAKGAIISAGSVIGLSGGENPGYPGALHPALPQFSSGAHVEYNLSPSANIWSGGTINPLSWLRAGNGTVGQTPIASGTQTLKGGTQTLSNTTTNNATDCGILPPMTLDPTVIAQWVACHAVKGDAIGNVINGPANLLTEAMIFVTSGFERIGFFLLAVTIVILGIILVAYEPLKEGAIAASKAAVLA